MTIHFASESFNNYFLFLEFECDKSAIFCRLIYRLNFAIPCLVIGDKSDKIEIKCLSLGIEN